MSKIAFYGTLHKSTSFFLITTWCSLVFVSTLIFIHFPIGGHLDFFWLVLQNECCSEHPRVLLSGDLGWVPSSRIVSRLTHAHLRIGQ